MARHRQTDVVVLASEIEMEAAPIDDDPRTPIEDELPPRDAVEETGTPQGGHFFLMFRQTDFFDPSETNGIAVSADPGPRRR